MAFIGLLKLLHRWTKYLVLLQWWGFLFPPGRLHHLLHPLVCQLHQYLLFNIGVIAFLLVDSTGYSVQYWINVFMLIRIKNFYRILTFLCFVPLCSQVFTRWTIFCDCDQIIASLDPSFSVCVVCDNCYHLGTTSVLIQGKKRQFLKNPASLNTPSPPELPDPSITVPSPEIRAKYKRTEV